MATVTLVSALAPGVALGADAQPAPPYPPPPPRVEQQAPPPRVYYPPAPPPVAPPPPLSPLMRAVYAPFYVAGLIVRYGVYYVIVAPLEVFSRAVSYGTEGGVERRQPAPRPEDKQ